MSDAEAVPEDLAASGRELWTRTLARFALEHHELAVLHQACRTVDRLDRLAEEGRHAPLTSTDRKGDPMASPLLVEARQQSITFARLVASLRLPDDGTATRPQRRGGARGTYNGGPAYEPGNRWTPRGA